MFPFLNFALLFIVLGLKGPLSEQWEQYELNTIQETSTIRSQSTKERQQSDTRSSEGHCTLSQCHPRLWIPRWCVWRDRICRSGSGLQRWKSNLPGFQPWWGWYARLKRFVSPKELGKLSKKEKSYEKKVFWAGVSLKLVVICFYIFYSLGKICWFWCLVV